MEAAFRDTLTCPPVFDKARFCRNLNELLEAFSIGNMELARYLSYDASYLSRIRSGQRTPRDTAAFALRGGGSLPGAARVRGNGSVWQG